MSFNSVTFIWFYLPLVISGYFIVSTISKKHITIRNLFLVIVSFLFYAWGDVRSFPFLIGVIVLGWCSAIIIERSTNIYIKKGILFFAVILQLGALVYYKYLNFIIDNVKAVTNLEMNRISYFVPLGISFIVFQGISYVVDVYRGDSKAQMNLVSVALYYSFFPQLITGPIVRYSFMEESLTKRQITVKKIYYGIKRFVIGLAKKVIIADCLGQMVDSILELHYSQWGTFFAWLIMIGYSMQIYYDFSGYTDMAIGIGQAFGFKIPENFDMPYISKSVREFWRRWHISLSSWFRDYVYIPLGGNRKGTFRTYVNLMIVFLITGLWHGASWNFILWGLWHGIFMLLERFWLGSRLSKCKWSIISSFYTLAVVFVGWIFFRVTSLSEALYLIKLLVVPTLSDSNAITFYFINPYTMVILLVALFLCGPIQRIYKKLINKMNIHIVKTAEMFGLILIFLYSLVQVVASTYSAFIYQQF